MPLSEVPADVMKQLPAGVTPVDAVAGPNGQGYYVVGKDGGVFALGGAPYLGSYTGLAAGQRQGTRNFSGITINAQGGYTLISDKGEQYAFNPPQTATPTANTPTTPPISPATPGPSVQQQTSAQGVLHGILDPLGLGGLVPRAMQWATDSGNDSNYIYQQLRGTPEYQAAFPEMAARQKNNLPAISESDILSYRASVSNVLASYGMPQDTFSQQDISNFISNDVSPVEIKDRVEKGYVAAMQAPPEFRAALAQNGVDTGQLAHFFLDPTAAYNSIMNRAAVGASAMEQGYGALTTAEQGQLAGAGVTQSQADTRFGDLYNARQLFNQLPGNDGTAVGRDQQIAYAQGLAPAQEALQQAAKTRVAQFNEGGGFATGSSGVSGLGNANG